MNSYFVGNKSKPSFLLEVIPSQKLITIYKPDEYSKNEEFYEKYSLGTVIIKTKFKKLEFSKKPIPYKNFLYTPEAILLIKNIKFNIGKSIEENI